MNNFFIGLVISALSLGGGIVIGLNYNPDAKSLNKQLEESRVRQEMLKIAFDSLQTAVVERDSVISEMDNVIEAKNVALNSFRNNGNREIEDTWANISTDRDSIIFSEVSAYRPVY